VAKDWQAGDSGRAGGWFPLVGLIIGSLTLLSWQLWTLYFPPLIVGVLTLLVWIILTGGLHLDGLADCCEGMFVSVPLTRRLEIMKDPHLGAFGVIGLLLVLFCKAAALSVMTPSSGLGILLAATISRWLILPASLIPLAHPGGMGEDFALGLKRKMIWLTSAIPLGIAIFAGVRGVLALLAASLTGAFIIRLAYKRLGGISGDVFGMLVEVTETVVLLSFIVGVK
jgi:adenosylcobinamide-GDP ribazoletransferase